MVPLEDRSCTAVLGGRYARQRLMSKGGYFWVPHVFYPFLDTTDLLVAISIILLTIKYIVSNSLQKT